MSQPTSQQRSRSSEVGLRPRRDFEGLKRRRQRAAELFEAGHRAAQVAEQLEVSVQAASVWHRRWREAGSEGLEGAGRAGRKPRLDEDQLRAVEAALVRGARANGYHNELWTLSRVAEVIERTSGVRYHPGHVWRLLRGLGWSRQKPSRWAAERDQGKVDVWVAERWPELKRGPSNEVRGSSSKTRAASR